mmetsp:Transcript_5667/g.13231  ORF Transcript_5667/g.13231 Transcript_5667/m.13231 type:complete len:222 (-) Transcript_5667:1159-1824(-)
MRRRTTHLNPDSSSPLMLRTDCPGDPGDSALNSACALTYVALESEPPSAAPPPPSDSDPTGLTTAGSAAAGLPPSAAACSSTLRLPSSPPRLAFSSVTTHLRTLPLSVSTTAAASGASPSSTPLAPACDPPSSVNWTLIPFGKEAGVSLSSGQLQRKLLSCCSSVVSLITSSPALVPLSVRPAPSFPSSPSTCISSLGGLPLAIPPPSDAPNTSTSTRAPS